ncbi:M16 family metallopeptidase [Hymenobacter chitinivorans]|uniref:Putative Zn-dependent peptidase n=1 Tax=Hymenobacter chitinivorans DSM 11115 TaxID=1121954 RepID=A0A2M9AQ59_9BACT|nr:pitrilysin family protein [Hymenobacter chitinivorans]PJJ47830.1 putative Zn-dependent peptidase [Hymenobacter chitinivorans DSM 11115]
MLDRQVAPPVQPLASVTLPAADVFSLPNGARLHVIHNSAQPVVRLQLVFPAGKWYEPVSGLSMLTARMVLEGTLTRTARQIADEVAFYGASLECEQGFDQATLTLYCLSRHLESLLPVVADVISAASFPEAELAQLKARTIQNIRIERQKTSYLASEHFSRTLYGPSYPYGRMFDEGLVQEADREELLRFYQSAYQLSAAEIFLCGDVSSAHIDLVTTVIGRLPTLTAAAPPISAALATPSTAPKEHVTVADAMQSSLRIGRVWPNMSHPAMHKLQVLIKVLGGYFGSRLMKNIREDKGLTYGIYASIGSREHANNFVIGTDVNAASTSVAVQEIYKELDILQSQLIPQEELQTVKNYMVGKFANELSTVFEQCDKYKNLVFLDLPASYYSDFIAEVNQVTADELQALAQEYLSPISMTEVIAGP